MYPDDYQMLPGGEGWLDVMHHVAIDPKYTLFDMWKMAMEPPPGKAPIDMFGKAITCPSEGTIIIGDSPATPTRRSVMLKTDGTPLLDERGQPQFLYDAKRNLHGMVMLYDGCPGAGAPGARAQFENGWTPVKTLYWWQQNDSTTQEGTSAGSQGGARVGGQVGGTPLPASFPRFNPFARNPQR